MKCSVQKQHKTNQILACGGFGARKHTIKNFPNDFHFLAETHNAKNIHFTGSFFCHPIMSYMHVSK